ncbi:MAG: Acyl-CoA synthetase (AMP-forming)/AMP-acid ligase, partial [Frankiales bacterium]|nr:Acyl-CoA synthetase (AMP-forming)/AMP-acid ligase [Frankiales bacterium]
DIAEHLSTLIARYKVPRFVHAVDLKQRSPSGKPDYGWAVRVLEAAANSA